jgi:hypothetical protein
MDPVRPKETAKPKATPWVRGMERRSGTTSSALLSWVASKGQAS